MRFCMKKALNGKEKPFQLSAFCSFEPFDYPTILPIHSGPLRSRIR